MKPARPICYSCEKRRARVLVTRATHYQYAARGPIFCSYRCAADFGLLNAGPHHESPVWCPTHACWTDASVAEACPQCDEEAA